MPMIPEAVEAMLATVRLGASHSVVFGGKLRLLEITFMVNNFLINACFYIITRLCRQRACHQSQALGAKSHFDSHSRHWAESSHRVSDNQFHEYWSHSSQVLIWISVTHPLLNKPCNLPMPQRSHASFTKGNYNKITFQPAACLLLLIGSNLLMNHLLMIVWMWKQMIPFTFFTQVVLQVHFFEWSLWSRLLLNQQYKRNLSDRFQATLKAFSIQLEAMQLSIDGRWKHSMAWSKIFIWTIHTAFTICYQGKVPDRVVFELLQQLTAGQNAVSTKNYLGIWM